MECATVHHTVCNISLCFQGIEANHGAPPISMSMDNHRSYSMINRCLLGILPQSEMQDAPFWKTFGWN